jgi:hypothetical protein
MITPTFPAHTDPPGSAVVKNRVLDCASHQDKEMENPNAVLLAAQSSKQAKSRLTHFLCVELAISYTKRRKMMCRVIDECVC